jgi:hypothetical protein
VTPARGGVARRSRRIGRQPPRRREHPNASITRGLRHPTGLESSQAASHSWLLHGLSATDKKWARAKGEIEAI